MLSEMTEAQLRRTWRRAWVRMTRYDGYQPFGYDWPTLRADRPAWARTMHDIAAEIDARVKDRLANREVTT